ncbi:MAG: excinuclease ABC subunit UvrC [Candidatus Omnitrophota bacterium]
MVTKEKIKHFPDGPGVYLMKDKNRHVIYVGKARSLKKRLKSYFLESALSIKTEIMLFHMRDIEVRTTASEHEALLLENELIKRYRPRFNTSLKDDKSYPLIKITRQAFPRVLIGRRRKTDEAADVFGPYTSANLLRRALKILRKSFPFCTCRRFPRKVCLHYHLGLCAGPCQRKISQMQYRALIRTLEDFLTKKDTQLISELSVRMRRFVENERFEEAAGVRDQLEALTLLISLKKLDARQASGAEYDLSLLGLSKAPVRIEAFDISNIGGRQAVGSMVSFYRGGPDKTQYRRFKIKTVDGIDDYDMMREVLRRRYGRLLREAKKMPDLVVIDGGRGHLEAARDVLKSFGLAVAMIAIAKREELIYTVRGLEPVQLGRDSKMRQLIECVRDEAHRFALKYHHVLRRKKTFQQT